MMRIGLSIESVEDYDYMTMDGLELECLKKDCEKKFTKNIVWMLCYFL